MAKIALLLILVVQIYLIRNFAKLKVRSYIKISFSILTVAACLAVIFPSKLQLIANFLGIGRGTDLVLYTLCMAFIGAIGLIIAKHREVDYLTTKITREIALSQMILIQRKD
jgi:hypothetical protein